MFDAAKQVTIPLLGAQGQQLSIWLFRNVKNAKYALHPPGKLQTMTLQYMHIENMKPTVMNKRMKSLEFLTKCTPARRAIQQQLVAGSLEPELAFINANMVGEICKVQLVCNTLNFPIALGLTMEH